MVANRELTWTMQFELSNDLGVIRTVVNVVRLSVIVGGTQSTLDAE